MWYSHSLCTTLVHFELLTVFRHPFCLAANDSKQFACCLTTISWTTKLYYPQRFTDVKITCWPIRHWPPPTRSSQYLIARHTIFASKYAVDNRLRRLHTNTQLLFSIYCSLLLSVCSHALPAPPPSTLHLCPPPSPRRLDHAYFSIRLPPGFTSEPRSNILATLTTKTVSATCTYVEFCWKFVGAPRAATLQQQ